MSIFKFNDLNAESNVEGMRHQVVALYQEGLSKRKIAERLGKSTTFVTLAIESQDSCKTEQLATLQYLLLYVVYHPF